MEYRRTKNYISTVSALFLSTLANFILTPIFIKYVGVQGLGVAKIALSIPLYVSLFSFAILSALGRYLTIELQGHDYSKACQTLSTSVFSILGLYLIAAPIISLVFYSIATEVSGDGIAKNDVLILFFLMYIFSAFGALAILYVFPYYAMDRLLKYNTYKILAVFTQTVCVILALHYISSGLISIGASYVAGSLVAFLYATIAFYSFRPELKISLNFFSVKKAKELFFVSKWGLVENFGLFILLGLELVWITYLLGTKVTGIYSIFLQVAIATFTIAKSISAVFGPRIFSSYSDGDDARLRGLLRGSMILVGGGISLLCMFISGASEQLVQVWLGSGYDQVETLLRYGVLPLGLIFSSVSISYVYAAALKIKIPAVVTFFSGCLHLVVAYLFSVKLEFGVYGFAASWIIAMAIRNSILPVFYAGERRSFGSLFFIKIYFFITVFCFGEYLLVRALVDTFSPMNFYGLIGVSCLFALINISPALLPGARMKLNEIL